MKDFLKYTLASMVGFFLANIIIGIIFTIFFLVSVGSVMSMAGDFNKTKEVDIEDNSVLQVKLDYPIKERTSDDPFKRFQKLLQDQPTAISIREVLNNIEKAKRDDEIEGILLEPSLVRTSYANLQSIRNELKEFKQETDKFIYAYGNVITQKGYYLSNLADSIFLQKEGMMQFTGMNSEMVFYKGLFDKLGITPHVFKAGKFKSAAESFSHKKMTEPNRKQIDALLTTMDDHFLRSISETRGINVSKLKNLRDEVAVREAEDAREYGFVDKLVYRDEMDNLIKTRTNQKEDELNKVTLKDYTDAPELDDADAENEVAIVYATGGISTGEGDRQSIGSASLTDALENAREDEDVKSIVLRINSPGGSALASDIIWREVSLTTKEKPVIVSMGNVAASGGYYIAAPADTIMAQPNTITGSIGVIGILFDWKKFWNDKTGVTFDRVKKGEYADLGNPNRPITEKEKTIINDLIMKSYDDFLSRVSEGRGMAKSMVDSLAQGRVWSGEDAKEVGLVDALGGFENAIEMAADKADLENFEIEEFPELEDPIERFMSDFSASLSNRFFSSEVKQKLDQYDRLRLLKEEGNGVYMLMPYDFNIQ